jgi:hypothetical protein
MTAHAGPFAAMATAGTDVIAAVTVAAMHHAHSPSSPGHLVA